jgi:biopolymer transport protein ExbB/TolQ
MSLNLLALWDVMGNVARGVVVLLLGMSVFSFTVALERLFAFRRARRQSQLFARQVGRLLDEDRVEETIALARSWSHSHLAKLVAAGLVEYERKSRLVDLSTDDALASARRAAERAMLSALSDFKRGT